MSATLFTYCLIVIFRRVNVFEMKCLHGSLVTMTRMNMVRNEEVRINPAIKWTPGRKADLQLDRRPTHRRTQTFGRLTLGRTDNTLN